jgi:AbrB family looped-hinge helix DNA binding protein
MDTVTLSTKGQLVLPKRVRDALGLKAGDRLRVVVADDGRIVLAPEVATKSRDWKPLNPAGRKLRSEELCRPVDLKREAGSR